MSVSKRKRKQYGLTQNDRMSSYYIGLWAVVSLGIFMWQWFDMSPAFGVFPQVPRDIDYGGLVLALVILAALVRKNLATVQLLARALTLFSSLLAIEHFRIAMHSEEALLHWISFSEHIVLGTCLGICCMFFALKTK